MPAAPAPAAAGPGKIMAAYGQDRRASSQDLQVMLE
jgi:hypothetical protein